MATNAEKQELLAQIQKLNDANVKHQKEIETLQKTIKAQEAKIKKLETTTQTKLTDTINDFDVKIETVKVDYSDKFAQVNDLVASHNTKITELINKVSNLEHNNTTKPTFASLFKTDAVKATLLTSLNREKTEQDAKRSNIVISGIPVSDTPDIDLVKEISVEVGCDLSTIEITTRRIGTAGRILVKLNPEKRKELLEKAKRLRTNERSINVYINPDLTRAQAHQQYLLRCELRRKKISEPTKKWVIARGRVMTDSRPGTPLTEEPNQ